MISSKIRQLLKKTNLCSFIKFQKRCRSSLKKKRILPGPEYVENLPIFKYPIANSIDRRIYAWGFAATGALGIHRPIRKDEDKQRNKIKQCFKPMRVTFGEMHNVSCIAAGYGFSAFGIKSKDCYKIFGTGLNTDSQIGYHDPRKNNPLETLLIPAPIRLPLAHPETTKIIQISAGRAHLVVLTNDEGVFTLGNNSYGQCGRRINENENYKRAVTVHHIKRINGENIKSIECGQDHSLFVTNSGKVYACGWGCDGQLGNGNFTSNHQLNEVQGDIKGENIIKLSSAADCVLALNDKGQVFGWGNTEYGQLNSSESRILQCPASQVVPKCNIFGKIIDIAAGGSHCLMLNENGNVYSWGFGILGRGPEVQQSLYPTIIPNTLFGKNIFNPNSQVLKVFTGLTHSAAITSTGELYMWGKNKSGCLGFGNEKDQFFPLRTAVGAKVLDVSCGVDHTLALCKPFV